MAGTVTFTETVHGSVKKIEVAWTSTAGGAADGTSSFVYDGRLIAVTTVPGAAGDAPDANYDITLTDSGGDDVLLGQGANRHTSNTEYLLEANLGAVAASKLTLNVAAAGSANSGTVVVWLR